ncbi:MAG: hypothetical protein WBB67_06505 [bacterium]
MKYNEIATSRPLQFLMVGTRNDKKGFGQHALYILHIYRTPPMTKLPLYKELKMNRTKKKSPSVPSVDYSDTTTDDSDKKNRYH